MGPICLALIALCDPQRSYSALDPNKPLHQFMLQNWQADQGLPQNSVLAIAQTKDGYLWLGTEEGLTRYDGIHFVTFGAENSPLRDNVVRALLLDRQNTLWIGTQNGGLSTYRNGQFRPVSIPSQTTDLSVNTIFEDHTGVIWVGTDDSGLIKLDPKHPSSFTTADGLPENGVISLTEDSNGTLWVVTRKGLCRFRDGRFSSVNQSDGLVSEDVRVVKADYQGSVWVGTSNGLIRFSSGKATRFTTQDGLSSNQITSIAEDSAHSLWIGTGGNGLNRFADGRFSSISDDASVSGTDIGVLLEDRGGDLWIGTGGHGLICLKEGTFTTLTTRDGLSSNTILPVFEDRDGNLWIGSDHGLTKRGHGMERTFTSKDGLASDFIFSLTQDKSGAIWVGTRQGLQLVINDTVRPFPEGKALPTPLALALLTDKKGRTWVGTRGGLTRFDGRSAVTFTVKDGLPDNNVRCIQEDRAGAIWVGTPIGISSYKGSQFRNYTKEDGLGSDNILSIYCDRDNVLWLATANGLSRLRGGRITSFNKVNRLLGGSFSAVLEDRSGFLWLSSNHGVVKVAKRDLTRYADGVIGQQIQPILLDTADGLKSVECDGGFQPAGWVAHDGKLYFPTVAGLAVTDPARSHEQRGGALLIERLVINNVDYPPQESVIAPAGQGKLEIQFASPELHFQKKLRYRYMLEGFDKDWVDADTRRIAYYTNIPHGEYRFRAQAGIDGHWGKEALLPPLTLQPHFYETIGFFVAIGIAILSVGGAAYHVRMDQIASRELKLRTLVDERTSALRESESQLRQSRDELELRVTDRTKELTHVNETLQEEIETRRQTEQLLILAKEAAESANRAKSDFLANMSHELRTPINGILGMTEITLSTDLNAEQAEYLEIAKISADSLLSIVNDILDFSKIEARKLRLELTPFRLRKTIDEVFRSLQLRARQKNLHFELVIPSELPDILMGDPLRIRQVLLNLLDNALKFTSKGGVWLTVLVESSNDGFAAIHFSVRDSGIGISPDKSKTIFEAFSQADNSSTRRYGGTGLGLTISHQLAVMLGGNLWVESELGQGSTFHFTAKLQHATQDSEPEAAAQYTASLTV